MKFLNPKKIEIDMENMAHEVKHYECDQITKEMLTKVIEIGKKSHPGKALFEQIAVYFGGTAEDYKEYDVRVIKSAIAWMTDEMANPQLREG
jgi:hypothetical protein